MHAEPETSKKKRLKTKPMVTSEKPLSAREQSRLDTLDRIIVTARKLLAEKGYDATTTRQVAIKAGLGVGTLFNYVKDKRDLIYLIINKELLAVTVTSLAAPRSWETFREKILTIFGHHYRFFGLEPVLSRILLTEVVQHAPGFHLQELLSVRNAIIDGLEGFIAAAQQSGELTCKAPAGTIARSIFYIHSANVRWWLESSDTPNWRVGLQDLAVLLDVQLEGIL